MARDKYPFLHSISGLKELIEAIGKIILDIYWSFHTYCAEDDLADLIFKWKWYNFSSIKWRSFRKNIRNANGFREIPGDTEIIDLKTFLNFIISKGYDGPVSVEPFNEDLNKMEVNEKLQRVRASLLRFGIWLEFCKKPYFKFIANNQAKLKFLFQFLH